MREKVVSSRNYSVKRLGTVDIMESVALLEKIGFVVSAWDELTERKGGADQ